LYGLVFVFLIGAMVDCNEEIEKLSERVNELRFKVRRNVDKARIIKRSAAFDKNRFLVSGKMAREIE
jgi:hypothetical protein